MKTHIENLFDRFNERYFHNELKDINVKWARKHISTWGYFEVTYSELFIILSPILKRYHKLLEAIVIHEMIHAYIFNNYKYDSPFEHTTYFLNIQKVINQKHFGNPDAHEYYYQSMLKHLTNK